MKQIIVTTQEEINNLPKSFNEYTEILIQSKKELRVEITRNIINGYLTARENSTVTAWGNSTVTAWGNSTVTAWGNSTVTARENSTVTARGNSTVTAWENSTVTARENSTVTARENSTVTAWENSTVTAWGNSVIRAISEFNSIKISGFAILILFKKIKNLINNSKTTTIVERNYSPQSLQDWIESDGVIKENDSIILYKRVSKDFKTQEKTTNETIWEPNTLITHKNWSPDKQECGSGKFHACSQPFFCNEFRDKVDDKYIALKVRKEDCYFWKNGECPHKISFREGFVMYVCDKNGKKL